MRLRPAGAMQDGRRADLWRAGQNLADGAVVDRIADAGRQTWARSLALGVIPAGLNRIYAIEIYSMKLRLVCNSVVGDVTKRLWCRKMPGAAGEAHPETC